MILNVTFLNLLQSSEASIITNVLIRYCNLILFTDYFRRILWYALLWKKVSPLGNSLKRPLIRGGSFYQQCFLQASLFNFVGK